MPNNDRAAAIPAIRWVNHASFIIEVGDLRLLSDPWLEGTAFKDGWALISPTVFEYSDFTDLTHVWISHQHPDHFAPTNLVKVPADAKRSLTVFYREDEDKLVVSWLRAKGFANVAELALDRWIPLAPGIEVMCGRHSDDSWLALRTPATTLLNVNDVVLKRADDIRRIAQLVGRVDVLFTQFSYAQWTGNPADTAMRKRDAAEKLERIRLQDSIVNPDVIVPFASFVYFCNRENFHHNDGVNAVGDVAAFVETELGKRAAVLYPGDRWSVDQPCDWRPAAQRYAADFRARIAGGATHAPRPGSSAEFETTIRDFLKRLTAKNPTARLLVREKSIVYLTDLERAYQLSINGVAPVDAAPSEADVVTSSENVLYAFRTPWGGNTLHVSGRFTSPVHERRMRFFELVRLLHHYNRTPIDASWLGAQCRRVAAGIARRLGSVSRRGAV
ncbi:MAG TPA: MBL fold metallo-hydrolase [Candidatus Acidoferrales bacterium]|nr:MBL fold metallo-hydrolase [Candidatus Acidoferrales bacterium]